MEQLSPEFVQEDAPSQQSGTKAASSVGTPTRVSSPEERAARGPSSARVPVSGEFSDGSQSLAPPRSRFKPPRFMEQLSPEFVQKKERKGDFYGRT